VAEASQQLVREAVVRPELNAMVVEVMAEAIRSRRQDTVSPASSWRSSGGMPASCSRRTTQQPPEPRTLQRPDRPRLGALDVLIDSFNDLLIRLLVGLSPQGDDTLVIDPLAYGWSHFRLDQVPYGATCSRLSGRAARRRSVTAMLGRG